MKTFTLFVIIFIFLSSFAVAEYIFENEEKSCDSCRGFHEEDGYLKAEFCFKNKPSGDGCNTCNCEYYCIKDKEGREHWYGGSCSCTLAYCGDKEVSNPFNRQ
ncbi:MAG: hypothetical protein A2W22_06295 [Candidatus Levybacteria bacterium RBG_16_35_11]|nr:MAG: hypothetical protein A2W22_06295 [Candidatus Levybacteria bacterium RBG_16_35_11]